MEKRYRQAMTRILQIEKEKKIYRLKTIYSNLCSSIFSNGCSIEWFGNSNRPLSEIQKEVESLTEDGFRSRLHTSIPIFSEKVSERVTSGIESSEVWHLFRLIGSSVFFREFREIYIYILSDLQSSGYKELSDVGPVRVRFTHQKFVDLIIFTLLRTLHSDLKMPEIYTILPATHITEFIHHLYRKNLPYTAEVPREN
jgi:hypothetical protein